MISRDVILVIWSMWIRYKTLPDPKSVSKFFDVTLATAEIKPSFMSKVNTGVQLTVVSSAIAAPVLDFVGHPLLTVLCGTAAVTTLWSGWLVVLTSCSKGRAGRKVNLYKISRIE